MSCVYELIVRCRRLLVLVVLFGTVRGVQILDPMGRGHYFSEGLSTLLKLEDF